MPGWCDIMQDKNMMLLGQPFWNGFSVADHTLERCLNMSKCRAGFELTLRFCRQHKDQLKADAYARSLDLGDYWCVA